MIIYYIYVLICIYIYNSIYNRLLKYFDLLLSIYSFIIRLCRRPKKTKETTNLLINPKDYGMLESFCHQHSYD